MPQLDTVTFFSQYVWFWLIFVIVYFRVVINDLPKIATTLKIRKKVTEEDQLEVSKVLEVSAIERKKVEESIKQCLATTSVGIAELTAGYQKGVSAAMTELNASSLSKANQLYIDSIVKLTAAQYLLQTAVKGSAAKTGVK
jgi:hypothetical protein